MNETIPNNEQKEEKEAEVVQTTPTPVVENKEGGRIKKPKLRRSFRPGGNKGKWTLEKVRKRGIRKFVLDEETGKNKVNPFWRALNIQYNPECAEFIVHRIREGEPLHKILERPNMPSYTTFCRWMKTMKDYGEEVRAAKADAQFLLNEKMGDGFVAMHNDIETTDPKIANAKAALYKEEVNYKKWSMEKLSPKVFAPKPLIDNSVNIRQVSFVIETSSDKANKRIAAPIEVINVTPVEEAEVLPMKSLKGRNSGGSLSELIGETKPLEEELENV